MDEGPALLLLAVILTFVFGWNNSSILIGNDRGSGSLSGRGSVVLCSMGILLGILVEGSKMNGSLGRLVLGQVTSAGMTATLAVSVVFTLALTIAAIPVSFSNTIVGAFLGAAVASSLGVQVGALTTIVVFWGLAPLATMVVTFLIYKAIERSTSAMSLLAIDSFNRVGVSAVSLALAYVLGANNVGLFYGAAILNAGPGQLGNDQIFLLALAASAVTAMALFGRGNVAGTVGDKLLSLSPQGVLAAFSGSILVMWVATQLSIPVSISQCLIGGMFGAALTKRIAVINRRLALEVIVSWAVVPLAAFAVAAVVVAST